MVETEGDRAGTPVVSRSETRSAEAHGAPALEALRQELEQINADLQSSRLELTHAAEELVERTRALERSERLCAAILSSVHTGVALVDGHRLHTCNAAAADLLGIPRSRGAGSRLERLRGPLAKPIMQAVEHAQLEGKPTDAQLDVPDGDGMSRFRIHAAPLDEGDEPEVIVTVDCEQARG